MSIETLIDGLAADLKPVRRRSGLVDAAIIGGICAVELALVLTFGSMRPDVGGAMMHPSFWWKLIGMGVVALTSGAIGLLSFDPARPPLRSRRWVALVVITLLAIGWIIDAAHGGFATLVARLNWPAGLQCSAKVAMYAIPPLIGLGLLMRRGAPTDRPGTATLVGLAAAAWGAVVFVFSCPFDDPLYIAVWYGVGCAVVTGVSRLLLPRLARW
jgi:hypothetical protein